MPYKELSSKCQALVTNLDRIQVPTNIHKILNQRKWKSATWKEIKALEKNKTWVTIDLPSNKIPVGYKWIFMVKYREDGSVDRFKIRLVAKRFTQSYGID